MNFWEKLSEKLMDLGNMAIAGVLFGNLVAFQKNEIAYGWIFVGLVFSAILYTVAFFIARRQQ
ncbi:MAG: hypothetical protein A3G41_00250 [Elusimicrobia bacterium RIFCSPLOWO2_12_FULL_59_9]|nr:MAG: hypothetical protein A3G41_00250 [Elusimicrobia bacterium RIFCSPLOWO2_12_FULL_59_9]